MVYGALPASLGALGAFKLPEQTKLFATGLESIILLALVAAIPVLLTFVLVRRRLRNWYLLVDFLSLRSAVITVAIIIVSTAISGQRG